MRSPISFSSHILVLLGASLAVAGCTSGQIGGDIGFSEDGAGYGCIDGDETEVSPGEAIDGTPLTLDDLVDLIEGTHKTEMRWGLEGYVDGTTLTPDAGTTNLTVAVEIVDGSGRWVDVEVKDRESGDGNMAMDDMAPIGMDSGCQDELRVDARVTVTSESGALSDSFDATFVTRAGDIAFTSIELSPGELEGSFAVEVSDSKNMKAKQTVLSLTFGFGVLSGDISGVIESTDGQAVSAGFAEYGSFPVGNPCDHGLPLPEDAAIAQQVETLLADRNAFDLTWRGEESVELTFTPDVGPFCYESLGYVEESTFSGSVDLRVAASDDSIDGTWPLTVQVSTQGEDLTSVTVHRDAYMVDSYPRSDFEGQTGIVAPASSAEELGFSFSYTIEPSKDELAIGEITLLEMVVPDCARPDYEPEVIQSPDGGSSSAGCEGVSSSEIKSGTLLERQ